MVFCSKCGKSNDDSSKYCSDCGTKLMAHVNEKKEQVETENKESYIVITWIGRICVFIFLPASLVIGAYLISQPKKKVKDTGWTMILASVIVWTFYAIVMYHAKFV